MEVEEFRRTARYSYEAAKWMDETSLVVQGLASSRAGGADSVPGQETPTCLAVKKPKQKTETVL